MYRGAAQRSATQSSGKNLRVGTSSGISVPGETKLVQNDLTTEGSPHEGCNED